jgi:hypothetical protein
VLGLGQVGQESANGASTFSQQLGVVVELGDVGVITDQGPVDGLDRVQSAQAARADDGYFAAK